MSLFKGPLTTLGMTIFVLFISLLFSSSVHAQQKLETPEYSPDYCQFTAKFPEEPYITHRCDREDKDSCYNLISYTKVFELSSSIRVEIICNPATPAMYEQFTPKVMETTVRAMTKGSVIEAHEINTRQEDQYRQTGLLGRGRKGLDDTIYIAQLWIAENSIMSVEAELIGAQSEESDQHFADILRNIGFVRDNSESSSKGKNNDLPEQEENKENSR